MAALMVLLTTTTTKHQQESYLPDSALQPNTTFLQSLNTFKNGHNGPAMKAGKKENQPNLLEEISKLIMCQGGLPHQVSSNGPKPSSNLETRSEQTYHHQNPQSQQ